MSYTNQKDTLFFLLSNSAVLHYTHNLLSDDADFISEKHTLFRTMEIPYGNKTARAILYSFDKRFMKYYDTRNLLFAMLTQPMAVAVLMLSYILFCTWLGPAIMRNRPPFRLNKLIVVYDFSLVLLNLYICIEFITSCPIFDWELYCATDAMKRLPLISPGDSLLFYLACGYVSKWIELFDTVFFVLTKKYNHISILHLFHHVITPIGCWYITLYDPLATYWVIILITNSFVHVLMYTYYGLVAIGYKAIIRLKKLLTKVQIIQFCIQMSFIMFLYINGCIIDSITCKMGWMVIFVVCVLFINFYRQNFNRKKFT